ncbi:MAG: M36 family metallopeptidase, partial [Planctomycetes bacterium]|nr:M36 family metallopeptidase [Planctomycetota bacterium]
MTRLLTSSLLLVALGGIALAGGPDANRVAAAKDLARTAGTQVRWDGETGTPARVRFEFAEELPGTAPQVAAALLQETLAPLYEDTLRVELNAELQPVGSYLVLKQTRDLGRGRVRVIFEQRVSGMLVDCGGLSVELAQGEQGWRPIRVDGRYYPGLQASLVTDFDPALELTLLENLPTYQDGEITSAPTINRLIHVHEGRARASLCVDAISPEDHKSYRQFIDGANGKVISSHTRTCEAKAEGLAYDKNPGDTPRSKVPLAGLYIYQGNNRVTTDANGNHPLAGVVTLNNALAGPLLRVFVHQEEELTYSGPADFFLEPNSNSTAQDELAAWHHYMRFNAHLRATYPDFAADPALDTRYPLLVRYKRNGQPYRNAFFTPQNVTAGGESFTGYIAMGTFGGREAAKSGAVIQHEYCHALYSEIVQLTGSLQAGGLGEGLSDYFPAALYNDGRLGAWLTPPDGIRDLNRRYVWPQDNNGIVHRVGHIFAGALWRARKAAMARNPGDESMIDQAVAAGLFRMRNRPTLIDAREAVVEGDLAVNGGLNRVILQDAFNTHGIGPAAQNDEPILALVGNQTVEVGETLTITLVTDDPDGDRVQVMLSSLANSSYDDVSAEFTFTPDASQVGVHPLTITATDGAETVDETITILVDPAPGLALPRSGGLGAAPTTSTTAAG